MNTERASAVVKLSVIGLLRYGVPARRRLMPGTGKSCKP